LANAFKLRVMWRYLHTQTVARIAARVQAPIPDHSAAADAFLRGIIEAAPSFSLLQVGSYDGVSNDPVHDLIRSYEHVRAVLLEPQPAPFAKLDSLWRGNPRVQALQCALGAESGERPLYVIADGYKDGHPFPDQVASFLRSQVEFAYSRYVWRPPSSAITSIAVPVLDWKTLVQRHGPFDLVAIDAEGYDAEILQQIDFSAGAPKVVLYEHRCLTRRVQQQCEDLLVDRGYIVRRVNKADTLASRCGPPGF
jgi:FkbM family methyltransferase